MRLVLAVLVTGALSPACLIHDTSLPLSNDTPAVVGVDTVRRTVFYPDTVVCTLSVTDLNDSVVAAFATRDDSDSLAPWTVSLKVLDTSLSEKRIAVSIGAMVLGTMAGDIAIADYSGAATVVPFIVSRILQDPLDRLPLNRQLWTPYTEGDSSHVRLDYSTRTLSFAVDANLRDSLARVSIGMRTAYRLAGDISCGIEFRLRDDMVSGFEAGFLASTSPDTGRYAGRYFGVFLTGEGQWTTVKCRSVNLQTDISTITYGAGAIRLVRTDSTVTFGVRPMGPDTLMRPVTTFYFSAEDSLYIHVRFRVDDQLRTRHCDWGNFTVHQGTLAF